MAHCGKIAQISRTAARFALDGDRKQGHRPHIKIFPNLNAHGPALADAPPATARTEWREFDVRYTPNCVAELL
jgi:hypothetical protein